MSVAGIDAHATYSVIAIAGNTGQLVQAPVRRGLPFGEPYVSLCSKHTYEGLYPRRPERPHQPTSRVRVVPVYEDCARLALAPSHPKRRTTHTYARPIWDLN